MNRKKTTAAPARPAETAEIAEVPDARTKPETFGNADDPLKIYMREICREPLLDAEEEQRLGELSRRGTPEERIAARETLVRANLRLVVKIAHDFKNGGLPLADLIAEGNRGLLRAAERFLPDKGAKFSSYSAWWIRQAMHRAQADQPRVVRIPLQTGAGIVKVMHAELILREELGREPEVAEVAECLNLPVRTVIRLRNARTRIIRLDAAVTEDGDNTFADLIPDTQTPSPDGRCFDRDLIRQLRRGMRRLTPREQQVLSLRFFRNKTLEEVSRALGRTRERVRQIQIEALRKLRRHLADGESAA